MDFIIEVHTTWGQETIFLVRGCKSKDDAKQKLVQHYNKRMHVPLLIDIPKSNGKVNGGHYIFSADEVTNGITEISDYYPPEVMA